MTGAAATEDFDRWLDACRERFGDPPRRFGPVASWFTLWVPPPPWLRFEDQLSQFFYHRADLLRTGEVVWGHLVQANNMVFEPGPYDAPAAVVFNPLPDGGPTVPELRRLAGDLFALKDTTGHPPDAQAIADHLTDERSRPFGLRVPASFAGRHPCELSTIYVCRKHLPGRYLASAYFPLVVATGLPRVAMILPARYWPAELVDYWTREVV